MDLLDLPPVFDRKAEHAGVFEGFEKRVDGLQFVDGAMSRCGDAATLGSSSLQFDDGLGRRPFASERGFVGVKLSGRDLAIPFVQVREELEEPFAC